jgi:hypothetical protein
MFLMPTQVAQRRAVVVWSLFAGLAVLWDLSWCFGVRLLQTPGFEDDWRIVWAAYGSVDSRFLHPDSYLHMSEIVTGLCSILNFYVVHQLLWGKRERALVALFAVSTMELYGTVIYFGSAALDHFASIDTTSFVHAWLMFVGLNALWIVFPGWCIYHLVGHYAGHSRVSTAGRVAPAQPGFGQLTRGAKPSATSCIPTL